MNHLFVLLHILVCCTNLRRGSMKQCQGSNSTDKPLLSRPRKRPWDTDLVRIVDKRRLTRKPSLDPWHEIKLQLSKLYPTQTFRADYVQRRYFRARSTHSLFCTFSWLWKVEKLFGSCTFITAFTGSLEFAFAQDSLPKVRWLTTNSLLQLTLWRHRNHPTSARVGVKCNRSRTSRLEK